MREIKDVEIFSTGTHNGDTYTDADLDEMIANYSKVGYMPPLKDGHHNVAGAPALGWIQNLKRVGNKLVADFVDLHEKVYEAIKNRRYGTVSSEIFWNLKNNNGSFKKALKAVSLLGAEIPGVADLKPLREVVFDIEGGETKVYEYKKEEENMKTAEEIKKMEDDLAVMQAQVKEFEAKNKELSTKLGSDPNKTVLLEQLENAQAKLDTVTKKYEEETKKYADLEEVRRKERVATKIGELKIPALRPYVELFYSLATEGNLEKVVSFSETGKKEEAKTITAERVVDNFVTSMNKVSERLFKVESAGLELVRGERPVDDNPRVEVEKRIAEYIQTNKMDKVKDYAIAMTTVLDADPELKKAYAA